MARSSKRALRRALSEAQTYAAWLDAARALDAQDGSDDWRADDNAPELATVLLRSDIARMHALTDAGDLPALATTLHESLYRHQGDLIAPHLYAKARAGTKHIVGDYLDAVTAALRCFVDTPHPAFSTQAKLDTLAAASKTLGRPALLLSGGAATGFVHLGVAKAMFDQGLLPEVVCGSSIGAIMAGGLCARNDAELASLFGDFDQIDRYALRFFPPRQAARKRVLLDQDQLHRCAEENIGDFTFAEMKAHSGRTLCITVSPARARQKPRVLSAGTSPNVLVAHAAVASSAVAGLYPPVTLKMRNADGDAVPYLPAERWIDGTFQGDLPKERLGRLFNVNHTIVSQVNPHAIPFLASRQSSGLPALAADLALSSARVQAMQTLKVVQARVKNDQLHNALEHARMLAEQDYRGDTNIHPPVSAWLYRKMLSNPTPADMHKYIRMGERATWPKLALIRNQTRVARELAACQHALAARLSTA